MTGQPASPVPGEEPVRRPAPTTTRRALLLDGMERAALPLAVAPLRNVASALAAVAPRQAHVRSLGAAQQAPRLSHPLAGVPDTLQLPSDAQIAAWVRQMASFGRDNPVFPGIRIAGTSDEDLATQWLVAELRALGYAAWRESFPLLGWAPTSWALLLGSQRLDAYPLFYTPLAPGGVSGPLVYVGDGSNLSRYHLQGAVVLADQSAGAYPYAVPMAEALEVWDPHHTLNPLETHPGVGTGDVGLVAKAATLGAVAFIGIVEGKPNGVACLPNAGDLANPLLGQLAALPGAYVGPVAGARLKQAARSGGAVTWTCDGTTPLALGYNVVAQLAGQSAAAVQLSSHSDGGAVDDGSGVAAVLALAGAYARLSLGRRPYTVQVVITSGHFSGGAGISSYIARHYNDAFIKNVRFNVTLEHMGWHFDDSHGVQRNSDQVCPGRLCLGDTTYLSTVAPAVQQNALDRTFINPPQVSSKLGEGWVWQSYANEPSIWWFVPVEYLATTADTMDKYCPVQMRRVLNTFAQVIYQLQGIG